MQEESPSLPKTIASYRQLFIKIKEILPAPSFILLLAAIYYAVVFSLYSILTHLNFSTGTHDAGVYDQLIWLISRGRWPISGLGNESLFAIHVSFYCFLLAPLFWIWSNVNLLYAAQSVLLAASVFPIYLYAKKKLGNGFLALTIGLSFLLFPALQGMNMENFHPEVIITFFLAWTSYFMLKGNWKLFYLFAFISLLGKEDMGLAVAFIGLYLLLFKKEIRHGLTTTAAGFAWLIISNRIIMPLASGHGLFTAGKPLIYSHWFGGYAQNIFNPAYYWESIFNPAVFNYLRQLLEPAAYLPLLAPQILFMGLPQLLINALSRNRYFTSVHFHYNYVTTVFIFFALIEGLARLNLKKSRAAFLGAALLSVAVIENNFLSGLPLKTQWQILRERAQTAFSAEASAKRQALRQIPADASVAASYSVFPHLSHRQKIFIFPIPFSTAFWAEGKPLPPIEGNADYLALVKENHGPGEKLIIRYLLNSSHYQIISEESSVLLLKRRKENISSGGGANYTINNLARGLISNIYFPDSNYFFRNLAGEILPVEPGTALEISGYIYLPETGAYRFDAGAPSPTEIEVDGKPASSSVFLQSGFRKFKIKQLHSGGTYGLKLTVFPPKGAPYIIADRELLPRYDGEKMRRLSREFEKQRRAKENYFRSQPNLVKNGGFEKIWGKVPQEWRLEVWQEPGALCTYEVSGREKKEGNLSAFISHSNLADSRYVQEVDVKPGRNYLLSGWIKTVGVQKRGEGACLEAEGTPLRTEPIFGTNGWQYVEAAGKIPAGRKRVKLLCRLGNYGAINLGSAYFDGISLKEAPSDYGF